LMMTIEILFWVCVALIVYAYAIYPIVVWGLTRLFGRLATSPALAEDDLPSVSLLIAAYNEEQVIASRIENALALDYPADRLEVVVASDGSSDATAQIVSAFKDRRIRLLQSPLRRGKATVLNAAFRHVRGDIVLLSDANTFTDRSALRRLVRWFENPRVGIVCGQLVLTDPATGRNVDGLYWRYETFLKRCEGRLGGLLGANGAIYAIRRSSFAGIWNDTIVDDFVIPLVTRLRSGCEIVYDEDAVAYEETPHDFSTEFSRRSRIGAGGFQSIIRLRGLLNPSQGWTTFTFVSHKVLRWLCPFLLIAAFVTNLALINVPLYQLTMTVQALGYGLALLGLATGTRAGFRPLRLATMFTAMNAALLVGFWRWASGGQQGIWQRTAR
jgi:cellulose synthase/poly-beta-1,6-N-acetylglucosamine synthase-like glycosyltransferase